MKKRKIKDVVRKVYGEHATRHQKAGYIKNLRKQRGGRAATKHLRTIANQGRHGAYKP